MPAQFSVTLPCRAVLTLIILPWARILRKDAPRMVLPGHVGLTNPGKKVERNLFSNGLSEGDLTLSSPKSWMTCVNME